MEPNDFVTHIFCFVGSHSKMRSSKDELQRLDNAGLTGRFVESGRPFHQVMRIVFPLRCF